MENENRIIELLAESLIKFDQMILEQKSTNERLNQTNERLSHVEESLNKLNLQTAENTRVIFKLADKVDQIAELDKRVKELEKVVFK